MTELNNRLDEEKSPYLRQHAENPVAWQPWDTEALSTAKEEDTPIFLSIGYSSCHWCHVMEEESFESQDVADILNSSFIPIKVDREERPDIDSIYQTTSQLITGRGGWPLSVWLTPEQEPFYIGTYFPKEPSRGMPGFIDLLERIRENWRENRDEIEERASNWSNRTRSNLEDTSQGDEIDGSALVTAAGELLDQADREHGGFGSAPKFPQSTKLELLLECHAQSGKDVLLTVFKESLNAMYNGGIHDHLGGGFHRYSTDKEWLVPHFEKMLYDNALLSMNYIHGYQVTGDGDYLGIAQDIYDFVDTDLKSDVGGFYSTLDARGVEEEGDYYVWGFDELRELLTKEEIDVFKERFGATKSGNFEGRNILHLDKSIEDVSESTGLDRQEIRELIESAESRLLEERQRREMPGRDEKIITSWNSLMISSLAEGGVLLGDEYQEMALDAYRFLSETQWKQESHELMRRYIDDESLVQGCLDDYAYLARAGIDLHQATGDLDPLILSMKLGEEIKNQFWDYDKETLFYTSNQSEDLLVRPQEVSDASTPSSLAVSLDVLIKLNHFRGDNEYLEIAGKTLRSHSKKVDLMPSQFASLTIASHRYSHGNTEITVNGDVSDEEMKSIYSQFIPSKLITHVPTSQEDRTRFMDDASLEEKPGIWRGREGDSDETKFYVCRSQTCSPPLSSVDEIYDWIERL